MKYYDYNKAIRLINEAKDLKSASLGMREDWSWTAQTVWENGEFTMPLFTGDIHSAAKDRDAELKTRLEGITDGEERMVAREEVNALYNINIAGIAGSDWATPALAFEYLDGREEMFACFVGESEGKKPSCMMLGVLSGPCQDHIESVPFNP